MKEKVLKIADKVRLLNLSTSEPVKCKKCNDEGFIERADGLMECECRRKAREPVSYTHLDVYKRQPRDPAPGCPSE